MDSRTLELSYAQPRAKENARLNVEGEALEKLVIILDTKDEPRKLNPETGSLTYFSYKES
ncbi:unnamed protein product [Arabis nemorensis]|uniref:Uncharacterized protein n=1 Tax=Arabis nemorensis TaxID=586526 RepID=A0A565BIV8_9BRAS|nr:unnamed protein product [Arabis nemorensis]